MLSWARKSEVFNSRRARSVGVVLSVNRPVQGKKKKKASMPFLWTGYFISKGGTPVTVEEKNRRGEKVIEERERLRAQ